MAPNASPGLLGAVTLEEFGLGVDPVAKRLIPVEACLLAISELLRRKKLEGLLALEGKVHLDLDWRELEELELKEAAVPRHAGSAG